MLGGVRLDGAWGLRGHSDADVLLHAIGDACLGAAALGDLGDHFPDSDPTWRGAPSAVLLARILELVRARGLVPHNVDATVVAERPRLAPHRPAIRARVAELMGLPLDRVSVKASTNNGLGTVGRAEGVATFAVVLLVESGQVAPGQGSPGQVSGGVTGRPWEGGAPAAPPIL